MERLQELDVSYLDPLLIPFNQEIDSLSDTVSCNSTSVDDKFYTSISNENDTFTVLAPSMVKEQNDYVFDKQFVNPFFLQKNNSSTLLQALRNEEIIQNTHFDEDSDELFTEIKRKMLNFIAAQRTLREHAKIERIKSAIMDHRWMYSPKLISPFLKTFVQECFITETLVSTFQKTVFENARKVHSDKNSMNDCIFGFELDRFLSHKEKRNYFIRLFLPSVYRFPKQSNPSFAFGKYISQFFPNNVIINNGKDTIHSLLYNVSKYNNVDNSQIVANFIKSCVSMLNQPLDSLDDLEAVVLRAKKVQIYVILFLILKSRFDRIKVKRVERGNIQSTTNEFIFKANTLYFDERNNIWCIYMQQYKQPIYSKDILDIFFYMLSEYTNDSS